MSTTSLSLTLEQARAVQLAALGLLAPPARPARKADVLKAIRAMHVLQIDTISVVARSPYLVLWSRLGHYEPMWLDALLKEGKLFEYWAHAACFVPIEDYHAYRFNMLNLAETGSARTAERLRTDRKALAAMLEHLRINGAVRTLDFERPVGTRGNGWWDWKPQKRHLETLFTAGDVMVARREQFHRIYDLRERVLPAHLHDDAAVPSRDAIELAWTLKTIAALGVASGRWLGDYFRHAGRVPRPHPEQLVDAGHLVRVAVEGIKPPLYALAKDRLKLRRAAKGELIPTHTTLLSPFDPLVWDRERALSLFNFDYRIECYTPEAKRLYGYFTLPLLHRGALIGRVDAKAHRRDGLFEVKAMYLEPGVKAGEVMTREVAQALQDCALWHGTPNVRIGETTPRTWAKPLRAMLRA
jgi:uncharacterized protein